MTPNGRLATGISALCWDFDDHDACRDPDCVCYCHDEDDDDAEG